MQKLPEGFVRALTDTERPTLFSPPEFKPVIKHLLTNKKKEKFVQCMNKIDIFFKNYSNCNMYGGEPEHNYHGQWMNFLFIIVVSVCNHTKSPLSKWKVKVCEAEELQIQLRRALETLKESSEKVGNIFNELKSFPNTDELRPPSEMNCDFVAVSDLVDSNRVDQLIAQVDNYRATDGFYGHYRTPDNVGKFNTYLEYFFKELESKSRMMMINPGVMGLGHAFWCNVLKEFPDLNRLTNSNVKETREKLKNLSC